MTWKAVGCMHVGGWERAGTTDDQLASRLAHDFHANKTVPARMHACLRVRGSREFLRIPLFPQRRNKFARSIMFSNVMMMMTTTGLHLIRTWRCTK